MRSRSLHLFASVAVLAIVACAPPATPATGTPGDEQSIKELAAKYSSAMNSHDMKAFGTMLAADYEEVDPTGKHTAGRDSVVAGMTEMMKQMPADMKMSATTTYVKWIDAKHAIAGGTYQSTGMPAGMANHGAFMLVAVKQDSNWVMMSSLGADAPPDMATMPSMAAPAKGKGKTTKP
jgi:uncharacterized protein (TIGR02246 family)